MNWRKFLTGKDAGFWLFISLAFFGSMIWAKSRDPFERIWFTVKTPHYGKVKGVAVIPVGEKFKVRGSKFEVQRSGTQSSQHSSLNSQLTLPVVFYVYGSGGSLINSGNELRQLAELGMAAVAIEYNQTNQAAFEEQFIAARKWVADRIQKSDVRGQTSDAECWLGFSLGAERTVRFFLDHPEMRPELYVRLAGGMPEEFKVQGLKVKVGDPSTLNPPLSTKILLFHGENDEIFPVDEAKEAAAFFNTNGFSTELKIFPGKSHGFDADRALVYRLIGERIKAQLTPENPLPEFPVTKDYPYVLCILPAFLWAGFWIYLRKTGSTAAPAVVAGAPPDISKNTEQPTSNFEQRMCCRHRVGKMEREDGGLRIEKGELGNENIEQPTANTEHRIHRVVTERLLSRPAATLSSIPNGGEGRGEEVSPFLGSELGNHNIEQKSNIEHRRLKKWEIGLRVTAVILATAASVQTGIHLITPRLEVSNTTLRIARKWLLAPKWNEDFETLSAKPFWRGQKLKTLLTHVELANYCVYELINWKVDKAIYNEFVLSPVIDPLDSGTVRFETHGRDARATTDTELNWRRPLWEFFYPRIRHEDTPEAAAEIVARTLRERITISANDSADKMSSARLSANSAERNSAARSISNSNEWNLAARYGIETIWRDQITDEPGFQRIYVATLRSVGVGARLSSEGKAEFWTGSEWKAAPRSLLPGG